MREYELWLDESGSFMPDEQINTELIPSLVGGILIRKGALTEAEITAMTCVSGEEGFAHATDYKQEESRTVVLPALRNICEKGGKLVYFENRQRISNLNNRELYLRLLARGLVQLLQMIAKDGDFVLDIYIALRVDVDRHSEIISDEEYIHKLKKYIIEDKEKGILAFADRSSVNISILSARRERRLQLADFACNSRLTRNSYKFDGIRSELRELFDDDYIFHFKVETSEQRVQAMLASGDVASALMELYVGYGEMDHDAVFFNIMGRFSHLSYRLKRLHLNRFVSEIVAYLRTETDFEQGEAIAKNILQELFPEIERQEGRLQTDEALFQMNAWLIDMYLREGDVLQARPVLDEMGRIIRSMNYRIENLKHLYLYNDRKALYEISCMEYERAVSTMDKSISVLNNMIDALSLDDSLHDYFGNEGIIHSEMLGNAYCMKVYAEMFMQRSNKDLYADQLRTDTELALKQYHYEGELERNQQYRAHVEMVQGNYSDALNWLLATKQLEINGNGLKSACIVYLEMALDEDYLSRAFYLMYYIELMQEANEGGARELSEAMLQALEIQGKMRDEFLTHDAYDTDIRSDSRSNPEIHRDILRSILDLGTGIYHPLEVIHWKYALFLYQSGKGTKAFLEHFTWALNVCKPQNPGQSYLLLKVESLAISMDMLVCLSESQKNKGEYRKELKSTLVRAEEILKTERIPEKMREYTSDVLVAVKSIDVDQWMDDEQIIEMRKLAKRIAF